MGDTLPHGAPEFRQISLDHFSIIQFCVHVCFQFSDYIYDKRSAISSAISSRDAHLA